MLVNVVVARTVERPGLLEDGTIVERAIEPTVHLFNVVDYRADAHGSGEVQGDGIRLPSIGADVEDDAVEGVHATCSDHDGALPSEESGGSRSHTTACAGDEDDLPGE